MTTDFRALCARLADELDAYRKMLLDDRNVTHRLADEARAALAEPEPEGPTPQPVPVSKRLPGPGDCDGEGECYWFDPEGSGAWYQDTYQGNYTHWLPVHALPQPS